MSRLLRGFLVTLVGVPVIYIVGFLADRPWPAEIASVGLVAMGLLLALAPPLVGWAAARGAGRAGLVGALVGWLVGNLLGTVLVGRITVEALVMLLASTILCPVGAGAALLWARRTSAVVAGHR